MMNKDTVVAHMRGLLSKNRAVFDKRMIHPVRDWFIGVTLFFVIIIAGGVYSALLFVEYRNIATDENASEDPTVSYNEVLVQNMLTFYGVRNASYEALTERISATSAPEVPKDTQTSSSTIASSTQEAVAAPDEDGALSEMEGAVIAN